MQSVTIVRQSKINRTARVMQVEGMFDFPPSERSSEKWVVNLNLPEEWNIGLIVGPSGSGKTTIINELFKNNIVSGWGWSKSKSILDDFPKDMSIKEIIGLLSHVGFSSPPSWVRPFHVLSNGEQFRVNMARTLAEQKELAVVDEFTSVVDRTVAQIGSAAIQKAVRKRSQKFIAVSCHYDIMDWLEPDWVYKPQTDELTVGRSLHQRPKINLEVRRVHSSAWDYFRKFHYLDESINRSARCFIAYIKNDPVAFCAILAFPHATSPGWRISRLVTIPDYQGIGIGNRLAEYVSSIYKATMKPIYINTSHPAIINSFYKSKMCLFSSNRTLSFFWTKTRLTIAIRNTKTKSG